MNLPGRTILRPPATYPPRFDLTESAAAFWLILRVFFFFLDTVPYRRCPSVCRRLGPLALVAGAQPSLTDPTSFPPTRRTSGWNAYFHRLAYRLQLLFLFSPRDASVYSSDEATARFSSSDEQLGDQSTAEASRQFCPSVRQTTPADDEFEDNGAVFRRVHRRARWMMDF